jgi:hypothetical protein
MEEIKRWGFNERGIRGHVRSRSIGRGNEREVRYVERKRERFRRRQVPEGLMERMQGVVPRSGSEGEHGRKGKAGGFDVRRGHSMEGGQTLGYY